MRNTATATASAALFLLLLASPAVSQPAPTTSPPTINNIFEHQPRAHVRFPSLEIVLIVIIACLYISFQYCSKASAAIGASVRRGLSIRSRGPAESRGLDARVIESFPTFSYSAARDHFRFGNNECSVCLSEFEDGETIRLVPTCDHVFHPECIDAWLACHVTCPVCRADLSPPTFEVVVQVDDGIVGR